MRKLTRKQLLARLFVGFFTLGSLLCTVNSAVAEEFGEYKIEHSGSEPKVDSITTSEIYPDNKSYNTVTVNLYGPAGTVRNIYGGYPYGDGNTSGNSVIITTKNIDVKLSNVYGGNTNNGSATQNIVDIASSTVGSVYGGRVWGDGNVASNSVTIDKGITASSIDIAGGLVGEIGNDNSKIGNATNNKVEIKNGSNIDGKVYGGYVGTGSATQNIVDIASSTVKNNVYGGYTNKGNVLENKVNIASSTVKYNVCGGYIYSTGSATQNVVDISSSTLSYYVSSSSPNNYVYGGYVNNGDVISNKVIIKDSEVNKTVSGGYVKGSGSANLNEVDIASSTISTNTTVYYVYGGYVNNGDVISNNVKIKDSTVTNTVYGGKVGSGSATLNEVNIASSTVNGSVFGGNAGTTGNKGTTGNATQNKVNIASSTTSDVNGGYATTGSANLNEVYIDNSIVSNVYGGNAVTTGSATQNIVNITSGSTVNNTVFGGRSGGSGNADSNEVKIASSTIKNGSVYGGYVGSGDATQNIVDISSSTVTGVYGGYTNNGNVLENKVNIASSTVTGYVFGGQISNKGSATENVVDIASSKIINGFIYGGCVYGTGSATQNIVAIASSTVGSVYCGYAEEGNAASNSVHIASSTVDGEVRGGCVSNIGSATQNIVNIASSTVNNKVYGGGVNYTGNASKNIVNITSGSEITGSVLGGYTQKGDVISNKVTIENNSKVTDYLYGVNGGFTNSGNATSNEVKIASSTVNNKVYGGWVNDTGNASKNIVNITSGSEITGYVYGGYVNGTGSATQNIVDIASSTVKNNVYGGYINNGNVLENKVDIASSNVNKKVYGGSVGGTGSATQNVVDISSSTLSRSESSTDNYVYGGYVNNGDVISNKVIIKDSEVNKTVSGGYVDNTGSATQNIVDIASSTIKNGSVCGGIVDSGSAAENKVYISSSTTGNVNGGEASTGSANLNEVYIDNSIVSNVFGGNVNTSDANLANALENKVYITSSTVNENVYGGYVWTVFDGSTGSATKNEVHITSSTVTGSVYGGYVGGDGNATDNTVKISGGSEVKGSVYGGDATGDAVAGNKLIISGVGNKIGGSVKNFESVSFKLASDDDTTKPMLSIDDSMDLDQINSELPEGGFNGERTLIDGNTLNYATATYTINGTAVDGDKSLTVTQKNEGSVNVGVYKYALTESAIKLNAESTIAAVLQQSGKDPLSTDDRKIVVTSEMANNYSKIYGAFNADGGAATNATVELSEAVSNENLTIYGGYSTGSGVDVTTGNTLKVSKNGNKIKNIQYFSKLDFSLDSDNSNNPTMLALAADTVDLSKASINVNLTNALAEGQTVTLLGAAQQLNLSDDKLTIDGKALGSDLSLNIAKKVEEKYVNVGGYSLEKDTSKLSIKAKNAVLTSRYRNGAENLSVEKFVLTDELNKFKAIYGSYSADNSAAEGGKLFINEAVNLSETTLIGGKSAGNGEVKNNTLEISSAAVGSKVKGAEKFDNFKFTLAAGMSGSTPMLSTTDKILLDGATIDTDLSNLDAADDTKLVLLDNTEGKAAKHLLNGKEGNIINAKKNEGFVAISSVGYSDDEDKLAIDVKSEAAGSFINEKGELVGNKDKKLVLGSSAASNMRAGFSRASEAPDMSGYKDIYGIYSAGSANPTGATIEIVSAIDYSNSVLHGGYKAAERAFYAEGNTLRVKSLNSKVKGITDFETMEFDLPAETKNGDTMLKVTEAVDMEPTKTVAVEASKATGLKAGDSVNLIASDEGIKNFGTQEVTLSDLTDKTGEVKVDGKALVLALDKNGEKPNDNTKAPVEGISATMALVSQAGNLVSEKLDKSMTSAAANGNGEAETFAAMGGGHEKYETGSYVEADSWNIGFGLAKKGLSKKNPDTTYGLFFQYGKSSFDTHNDGGYRGDGDSKMFGAGLMFHQEARSKYYYQGSISAGKVDADWRSKDGSYDDKATYYGMTFGMGRKHNAGGNKTMDIYGRYSFNHVGSMNGDLNGLKYSFDSTDSHNLRFGFRMEYAKKNSATAYWGLAWEHEFAGDSTATVATLGRTESPTLKGDSGIAEVGYQWKRGDWDYNINAEGSFGKREGVTGSFNINYNF